MRLPFLCLLFSLKSYAQNALPIGSWREHMPYSNVIDITASPNKIYGATPYSLFSVDVHSNETERISKISGLSETGISTIKFDVLSGKLFVAYTNSNIDVIDSKTINNIPDLKRETIAGNKTINHIYPANNVAYLSTGFGIVVINTNKYEIKDSWLIGNAGGFVNTNMFTTDNLFFYAATDEGLKRAPINSNNPADFTNWQTLSGTSGLSKSICKAVVNLSNKIVVLQNDSLFYYNGTSWNLFFTNGQSITSLTSDEKKIAITQQSNGGRIIILNENGDVLETISHPKIGLPQKAILHNSAIWIGDKEEGLFHWKGSLIDQYKPNSPAGIVSGEMQVYNNKLYAAAGSVSNGWNALENGDGIFKLENGTWTNYNEATIQQLDGIKDLITIAVDRRDESIWAGSFGDGLININKTQTTIYKENSPLQAPANDPGNYKVSGLAFDSNNNLWTANYGSTQVLHVLKSNNTWQSFAAPFSLIENAVAQIVLDDYEQKWIISPGNGLLVFNNGNDLENTSDDQWRIYKQGQGTGNLPSNKVLSIAKDKSGFIWVGTVDGIGIIQCPQDATTNTCEAILPVAENTGFASYLFKGEEVRSIAVDGADRKWIGTKNGVWLISANGEKVLERFTEENSFLLSNDVQRITINAANGEVFFATSNGLCSYKGAATEGGEVHENLLVYPNPVQPGYAGPIAIKGLAANSFVKITELNGRLVYQTKTLGGQAIWNGKDYKGRQISSGIYLVLVTDEGKQERAAGKIVFIAK